MHLNKCIYFFSVLNQQATMVSVTAAQTPLSFCLQVVFFG